MNKSNTIYEISSNKGSMKIIKNNEIEIICFSFFDLNTYEGDYLSCVFSEHKFKEAIKILQEEKSCLLEENGNFLKISKSDDRYIFSINKDGSEFLFYDKKFNPNEIDI